MIEQTQALILRTIPYSETSLIVHWLSEDLGRVSTLARGAHRPKSEFRGKLDLFHHCQITFKRNTKSTLHLLKEVILLETFGQLSQNIDKMNQAAYASQLTARSTEEDTPIEGLFHLMMGYLKAVHSSPNTELLQVLCFEFRMISLLGLEPQWRNDRLTHPSKQYLQQWSEQADDWEWDDLKGGSDIELELFKYLGRFITYHLGLPPKLRSELLDSQLPKS